ncbi:MAG: MgtC/SapB family protein [Thermomicrobiales bacterium]
MTALIQALQLELALRIAIGFLLGAVIGVERERWSKAAGLRTHMLVSGGSAIFTVVSANLFDTIGQSRDPARVAAQIVTGIGFLGAGAIIRSGGSVSGLTTAATIWVAAGLGMLAGVGAYSLALVSVVFTLISLILPHKWLRRDRTPTDEDHYLHPTGTTRPASLTATPDRCYHSALRRPHRGPHQPR